MLQPAVKACKQLTIIRDTCDLITLLFCPGDEVVEILVLFSKLFQVLSWADCLLDLGDNRVDVNSNTTQVGNGDFDLDCYNSGTLQP